LYCLAILLFIIAKSSLVFAGVSTNLLIIASEIFIMDKEYAKYLLEKTRDDYNAIAQDFSSTRRFVWRGLEPLYHYASPGDKILDLGCGNGRLLQILKNIDYIGVDSSEKLIEVARKTYPNNKFWVADALQLPFSAERFDKIYSIAVFHHIPSEEMRSEFLTEAKRVLARGGLLILTVWNLRRGRERWLNLKFYLLRLFGLSRLDFGDMFIPWGGKYQRYIHCFTEKELSQIVRKAGFKVEIVGKLRIRPGGQENLYIVARK